MDNGAFCRLHGEAVPISWHVVVALDLAARIPNFGCERIRKKKYCLQGLGIVYLSRFVGAFDVK